MRLPATSTRLTTMPKAVDTGRADTLFRLATAWRACPKDDAADGGGSNTHKRACCSGKRPHQPIGTTERCAKGRVAAVGVSFSMG